MFDARIRESYRDAAVVIAACLALGACSEDKPERAIPTLDAEYAGCAAVYRGPVCTLNAEERELVFWAEVPRGTAFRVRAGEEALAAAQEFIEGGVQIRATIPENATEVVLERMENNEVASAFKLPIRPDDTPTEITEALALRSEGKFDEAEAKIRPLLESDDELVKTRARSTLARIELSRGNHEQATAIFEGTSDHLFRLGAVSLGAHDGFALAHVRGRQQWDLAGARQVVERVSAAVEEFPEASAFSAYYLAAAIQHIGDLTNSGEHLERAELLTRRLGMIELESLVVQRRVTTLQASGRNAEATQVLDSLRPRSRSLAGCNRADYFNNLAWARLVEEETAADASRTRSTLRVDPREPLEIALRTYVEDCNAAEYLANTYVNLALAAWHRNDEASLAEHLESARASGASSSARVGAWFALIEARALARAGAIDEAIARFRDLAARCEAAQVLPDLWRVRTGLAQVLVEGGRRPEAIDELRRAEAALDEASRRVALGDGREAFTGDRDLSARLLIDQLIASNQLEAALAVARHARGRVVRAAHRDQTIGGMQSDARERWTDAVSQYWRARAAFDETASSVWGMPAAEVDELAAAQTEARARLRSLLDAALATLPGQQAADLDELPAAGVLWLTFFPGAEGWLAIARTDTRVAASSVGELDVEAPTTDLAARLLDPFSELIRESELVRVVTYGELDRVDFGALPWDGRQLIDSKPVVYGVDVPPTQERSDARSTALLVADPTGDLPSARAEANELQALFAARGVSVATLAGDDASASAVVGGLGRASLLHYAGHGVRGEASTWNSTLPLARGEALALADVLALPSVPREVVLAACDAGASDDAAAGVPGLTLARAFVAAGAESVVAASGPVPDDLAARFSLAYHRARADHAPPEAFRIATIELAERDGRVPYRLYVP
jgi:tetratricopeptide (TPR) repeat protein